MARAPLKSDQHFAQSYMPRRVGEPRWHMGIAKFDIGSTAIDPRAAARAARCVASNAIDAADAALILQALGLIPDRKEAP